MEVMSLTEPERGESAERIYGVEERILDSCQPLLDGAQLKLGGVDVSLFSGMITRLGALLSSDNCRQTVDAARRELEDVRTQ